MLTRYMWNSFGCLTMLYSTFLLLSLILECAWARMDENEFIWCVVVYLFCRKTCVRPAFSSYYLEFGSLWSEMLIMRRDFDFSNAKLRLFQCYYMFLLLLGNVSSTTNISYILFILTANNLFLGFFNWFYYYLVMTFDMFLFFFANAVQLILWRFWSSIFYLQGICWYAITVSL